MQVSHSISNFCDWRSDKDCGKMGC